MPGTLFVVATPIGNLEDLSFRALRVLKDVQLIAAEDTRRTAKLLAHYKIQCPMVSLREHNERRETPRLLERLAAGESIALVSDAGTPTISDPGASLIRVVRERRIPVVPIPGPSAITTALSASGLPADSFVFLGFPPRAGPQRAEWLSRLTAEPRTVVFFEAPHRARRTLEDLHRTIGTRPILVSRELTKKYEKLVVYNTLAPLPDRGEFTIIVGPGGQEKTQPEIDAELATGLVDFLAERPGLSRAVAEEMAAKALDSDVRAVRNTVKKYKIMVKRQNGPSA